MPGRLWVQVHIAGKPYWTSLPVQRSGRYRGGMIAAGLPLMLAVLAATFGYLIYLRLNRPLSQLMDAADRLARDEQPLTVSMSGPEEIIRAAATFNRMAASLAMPTLLDGAPVSAERFIDDVDAIVQQLIEYARGGKGEAFSTGDLNGLVEQFAADFRGLGHDFSLELENKPRCRSQV